MKENNWEGRSDGFLPREAEEGQTATKEGLKEPLKVEPAVEGEGMKGPKVEERQRQSRGRGSPLSGCLEQRRCLLFYPSVEQWLRWLHCQLPSSPVRVPLPTETPSCSTATNNCKCWGT